MIILNDSEWKIVKYVRKKDVVTLSQLKSIFRTRTNLENTLQVLVNNDFLFLLNPDEVNKGEERRFTGRNPRTELIKKDPFSVVDLMNRGLNGIFIILFVLVLILSIIILLA
jgi:hypothetical protein